MVRRRWVALSLVLVVAAMALASGCVESSEEAALTPATAPTVVNSAQQTDSEGNTITAPAATAPAGGGSDTGGSGGTPPAAGDAAAGKVFFASACTSCHLADGNDAGGVGPQLAGQGFDDPTVRNQVVNGGGAMPPGLASGADLDNVVAYVLSIQ